MDIPGVVEDLLGNPVQPGDEVVGAFRIGNVAVLRVGTVLGFGERANRLTVRVRWHDSSNPYGGKDPEVIEKTGAIEAELKRFVKLSSAPVSVEDIPAANP